MRSSRRSVSRAGRSLLAWRARQWWVAGAGALVTAAVVGIPTDVVPTPLFSRSVPVQWWNHPTLALTSVLAGLVLGTYVSAARTERMSRFGAAGAVLSFFAVGCPVCNKLVLLLIGTSGALSYWAPLQPLLAVVSVALLAEAALRRLSNATVCTPAGRA